MGHLVSEQKGAWRAVPISQVGRLSRPQGRWGRWGRRPPVWVGAPPCGEAGQGPQLSPPCSRLPGLGWQGRRVRAASELWWLRRTDPAAPPRAHAASGARVPPPVTSKVFRSVTCVLIAEQAGDRSDGKRRDSGEPAFGGGPVALGPLCSPPPPPPGRPPPCGFRDGVLGGGQHERVGLGEGPGLGAALLMLGPPHERPGPRQPRGRGQGSGEPPLGASFCFGQSPREAWAGPGGVEARRRRGPAGRGRGGTAVLGCRQRGCCLGGPRARRGGGAACAPGPPALARAQEFRILSGPSSFPSRRGASPGAHRPHLERVTPGCRWQRARRPQAPGERRKRPPRSCPWSPPGRGLAVGGAWPWVGRETRRPVSRLGLCNPSPAGPEHLDLGVRPQALPRPGRGEAVLAPVLVVASDL